jgi:hypothetical protein
MVFILLVVSCKKIEPPMDEAEANDPIYLLEGLLNGDSLSLVVNDTSVFISSDPANVNGMEGYSSSISDVSNGFEVKMTLIRPEILIDQYGTKLIENGEFEFLSHQSTSKHISFSEGSNQGDYLQINVDGASVNGLDLQFMEYGSYMASMKFPNLNDKEYQIPITVGFDNVELNPNFHISSVQNILKFVSNASDVSHEWVFDNQVVSDSQSFEYSCGNGLFEVSHKVTDQFGNSVSEKTMIFLSYGAVRWVMNCEYSDPEMAASSFAKLIV